MQVQPHSPPELLAAYAARPDRYDELCQRIGSVIGPFAAAWLLTHGDTVWAMGVLGAVTALAGLAYAVVQQAGRRAAAMGSAP